MSGCGAFCRRPVRRRTSAGSRSRSSFRRHGPCTSHFMPPSTGPRGRHQWRICGERLGCCRSGRGRQRETWLAGSRRLLEGETLADRLNLDKEASVLTVLRATSPPHLALGFAELHAIRGLRAKLRFIARKLFPPRAYVAIDWPRAERGRLWMLFAYCQRLVWLIRNSGPGFRAWMKARREANIRRGE